MINHSLDSENLVLFFIVGAFLVTVGILVAWLLAPTSKNPQKSDPYECGIPTSGITWLQFNVGYYIFAILFLIFDVETVFLFPWAVAFKDLMAMGRGTVAFVEILIFFLILIFGLVYAWKKKALVWE